eukprot:7294176-Prymnesium_polylepis.1
MLLRAGAFDIYSESKARALRPRARPAAAPHALPLGAPPPLVRKRRPFPRAHARHTVCVCSRRVAGVAARGHRGVGG